MAYLCVPPVQEQKPQVRPHYIPFRLHTTGSKGFAATKDPQVIVAREEKELRRIEGLIGESFVPVLDENVLKDDVYLWVFSGQRPSTGYELMVIRATRKESPARLCLEVRDITPDVSGWGSDPALTYPYTLISIPRKEWPEAVELVDGRGHAWKTTLHKEFQAP